MADYSVDIQAKLSGFEKLDALEKQLNALEKKTVKINVDVDGKNFNSKNFNTNHISKQLQSSFDRSIKSVKFNNPDTFYKNYFDQAKKDIKEAKNINKTFSKELESINTDNVNKNALKIAKAHSSAELKATQEYINSKRKILNGYYDAKSSSMKSKLDSYKGQDSVLINSARKEAELYNNTLTKLKEHFDSNNSFTLNDKEVISSFNEMSLAAEKYNNIMTQVRNTESKSLDVGVAERSANSVKKYYDENTKAIKKYGVELKDLENRYRQASTVAEKSDLDNKFKNLKATISAEGLSGKSFFNELGRGFKQIGQFAYTYGAIQKIPELIGNMTKEVLSVDTAMTELRKVSDASDNQLSEYFLHATESAKHYGAEISDVISSAADWKRLGYSLEKSSKLADATTLLQRVGDNMTQKSSASGLISTLKGFGKDADEALSIVDKINQVANTQPIDTAGLFAGLERSASSMSAANNTLEQTISLITAANSVVQDPDSIGTAYKTISMRIRGATTELSEAGLDTEGMAESTAKLREEIMSLSGVDIMLDKNNFKSTYDILDELATKWSSLTDIQQASVTELIAGKRQGNIVSALMQNFDIARDTLNTAMNQSEGSAERELSNYQKSMKYSIDTFKAQFQELSTVTFDSDFLKGAIDAGTGLLDVLTQIVDVGGGIPVILGAIGGVSFFKNLDHQKVLKNFPIFLSWSSIDKKMIRWFRLQVYMFGSSKINQRGVIAGTDAYEYSTKAELVTVNVNVRNAEKTGYSAYGNLCANIKCA